MIEKIIDLPISKKILGQFYTKKNRWLREHIKSFILEKECDIAYDPFAGNGDLLKLAKSFGIKKTVGLDIDASRGYKVNDSLINIPHIDNALVITNPPYLTNYSAKRKNIYQNVEKYFIHSKYNNIYLIALEKILLAQEYVVAIIPETFINAYFPYKPRLVSVTIIEDNCFNDTETPICVVCFDGEYKSLDDIKVYKNDIFLNSLKYYENLRMKPDKKIKMQFNDINGNIALRAIDTTNPKKMIQFMKKSVLDYNLKGIKGSSRLITLINFDKVSDEELDDLIYECNVILNKFRNETDDVLLSPFKGNMKNSKRRRRLDYETARAIIERAYYSIKKKENIWTISNCLNIH